MRSGETGNDWPGVRIARVMLAGVPRSPRSSGPCRSAINFNRVSESAPNNMLETLHHPAAWRGDELLTKADWQRALTPAEVSEISGLSDVVLKRSGDGEIDSRRITALPNLAAKLKQIRDDLEHGSGGCLVRGFPVDAFDDETARAAFEVIARHIGTPVSQSAAGETIFSVRDAGFQVGHPQARGPNTKKRLSFHTDRCDVIGFLCLQPAKSGGGNQLVSSMTVYNEMLVRRPDLVEVLMRPFYSRRHNVDRGNQRPWCEQPVFSFCEGHFAASYLRVLIDRAYEMPELPDMTAEQREALDMIESIAAEPELHVSFDLERGDMLFLNNWVTLHRREEFEDYEEPGKRRHLLRVWLAVPNSRPIDSRFAANFGATAAGAVRGGMPAAE